MRRIVEIVRPHAGRLLLGILTGLAVSGTNGVLAWIVKPVVDNVFMSGNRAYLALTAVLVIVIFILRGSFDFIQNYLMGSIGAKIARDLRNELYSHVVYLPLSSYGRDTTGSVISRVLNDVERLQNILVTRVKELFLHSGTIVILTGVALYRRWDLTLMTLVVLPSAFYVVNLIGKRLKEVSRRAQQRIAHLTDSMSEGLTGIKIVKSFGMEKRETDRFATKNQEYYREFMRSVRLLESSALVMEVVAGAGVAFIVYYGGSLVTGGVITSGDFFSFMAAVLMIFTPAKRLANVYNGIQQAKAYLGRIDEVMEEEREREGSVELAPMERTIVYEDVTFRYAGREEDALAGVSAEIRKGEVVAIVGRSGSGKSTFVDLLARFYSPQTGRILIDGGDIRDATLRSLRAQVGIVSQNVILFNDTVRNNIAYGRPGASEEEVRAASEAAFAHDFVMELPRGYDTPLGEGGASLSGGQRQRISIARALLKDPPVLILDEATSALDTQSEMMVQRALDRIIMEGSGGDPQEGGDRPRKTIFIIAHRLSTIKRADRIIVLDRGRVVEVGTHEELLKRGGTYRRLHDLQYGEAEDPLLADSGGTGGEAGL
jgi:subfamily B ATP-binding cassette protein MsbA